MKNYLELIDVQGREVFIAAESIIVIVNTGGRTCSIICKGVAAAIVVNKNHHEIIKKLVELETFKLAKFE